MASDWSKYQENAAHFFRCLGLEAETNVALKGPRTSHDIDVVVRFGYLGLDVLWLVECKCWRTKVCKSHVLALRQIVVELGADRGILLSEAGFQSGAIEASGLTNVMVTSLAELKVKTSAQVTYLQLQELYDRTEACRERYWDIPKDERIAYGIRPDFGSSGSWGAFVIEICTELLSKGLRGVYPFSSDHLAAPTEGIPAQLNSPQDILTVVGPMLSQLESQLDRFNRRQ